MSRPSLATPFGWARTFEPPPSPEDLTLALLQLREEMHQANGSACCALAHLEGFQRTLSQLKERISKSQ